MLKIKMGTVVVRVIRRSLFEFFLAPLSAVYDLKFDLESRRQNVTKFEESQYVSFSILISFQMRYLRWRRCYGMVFSAKCTIFDIFAQNKKYHLLNEHAPSL